MKSKESNLGKNHVNTWDKQSFSKSGSVMRLLTVVAHSDRSFSKAPKCVKFIENIEEHHFLFGLEFSMKKWKCLHLDININQIETHVIDIYFTFVHLNRFLALFYNYCLCNFLFHSTIFTRPHKSLSCTV